MNEARTRRGRAPQAARALACGSGEGRAQDHPHRRCLRDRPGRLLAGPLAESTGHRGPRHSCRERAGIARAPARQDRPARHRAAQALLPRLAARRAGPAIPTFAEEDAKRPHRERETLVGEQTTIINRIKSTLARLGIGSFNPTLKRSAWSTCARPRASRSRPTRSPN